MTLLHIGVLLVIILSVFFGLLGTRSGKTLDDFWVAKRRASPLLVGASFTISYASGMAMVGFFGIVYQLGLAGSIWIQGFGAMLGSVILLVVGVFYRRSNCVSVIDFMGDRYNSNIVRIIAVLWMFVAWMPYVALQWIAIGVSVEVITGWNYILLVCIMGGFLTLYMLAGGQWSMLWSQLGLFIILMIGLVLGTIFVIPHIPEIVKVDETLDIIHNTLGQGGTTITIGTAISWCIVWSFGFVSMPHLPSRAFITKDTKSFAKAMLLSFLFLAILYTCLYWIAIGERAMLPEAFMEDKDMASPSLALEMPAFTGMFWLMAVIGAAMSTAAAFLFYLALGISRDFYQKCINADASEFSLKLLTRLGMLLAGIISIGIACLRPAYIIELATFTTEMFVAAYLAPVYVGMFWRGATKAGGIASIAAGIVITILTIVLEPIWPAIREPFGLKGGVWAALLAIVVLVVVSLFTQHDEKELEFMDRIHRKV